MARNLKEDPKDFPALGRMFLWVDKPGSAQKLVWVLGALCALVFLLNFTFSGKGHYGVENIPGFYAMFGFAAFTTVILVAKALRVIIKRPEDYYGGKAIDREEWPESELERKDHGND